MFCFAKGRDKCDTTLAGINTAVKRMNKKRVLNLRAEQRERRMGKKKGK